MSHSALHYPAVIVETVFSYNFRFLMEVQRYFKDSWVYGGCRESTPGVWICGWAVFWGRDMWSEYVNTSVQPLGGESLICWTEPRTLNLSAHGVLWPPQMFSRKNLYFIYSFPQKTLESNINRSHIDAVFDHIWEAGTNNMFGIFL